MKIYPSLISASLLELKQVISSLDLHCAGYHIDVMDDHFVPNLTWGPAFINAIVNATDKPLHVHLMVDNPDRWPERINLRPYDTLIVHIEVFKNNRAGLRALLENIKKRGWGIGIALNPETAIDQLFELEPDMILCMTVHPGFSGQKLIPESLEKARNIATLLRKGKKKISVWVDGGVDLTNIQQIAHYGIDGVGVASAIFSQKDPVLALKKLSMAVGNTPAL